MVHQDVSKTIAYCSANVSVCVQLVSVKYSEFRIRIRIRLDPYHWAGPGSRSTSGNVDLDPGSKKILFINKLLGIVKLKKGRPFLKNTIFLFHLKKSNKLTVSYPFIFKELVQEPHHFCGSGSCAFSWAAPAPGLFSPLRLIYL